jgi:lipopolysaccharide heptosyltransferase II
MIDPPRRVLVVRYGRIGDMLVVTPAIRAIARAHPGVRIDVLTSRDGMAVLADNPHVGNVHGFEWRRVPAPINPPRAALVRRLRATGYDTVFLLEGGEHHRALVRDLNAPRVYTFARDGEDSDRFHARRHKHHELFNFFAVLALAEIPPDEESYDFTVGDAARHEAGRLLERAGLDPGAPVAGLHAGHFRRRRFTRQPHAKTWPIERWIETAMGLLEAGFGTIVLTGAASEQKLNQRIAGALPPGRGIDLAGRTDLRTLAAIIERCRVFLAPDTGPAHLAAAVNTPLVALFGPKAPDIMGPRGDESRIARLFPAPSTASFEQRRGHHPRLWAITPVDVLEAVHRIAAVPAPTGKP